ncbi:MAG: diphthine--ammonia ligase [Candidatus Pacearchaeota archaeon]
MKSIKTAVLFSGGKDSCLALYHALKNSEVRCLITIVSENKESYMFHTPNIILAKEQAEAIGLPIIIRKTPGEKEHELKDLKRAIEEAKAHYKIEAVITGAIASFYQKSRIEQICKELNLKCINPLWQKDQLEILKEITTLGFEVIVTGTFAFGMDSFVGRKIDSKFIEDIKKVYEKYRINPAGEGGEFETFTLNTPLFKKALKIKKSHIETDKENCKVLMIDQVRFIEK